MDRGELAVMPQGPLMNRCFACGVSVPKDQDATGITGTGDFGSQC